MAGQRSFYFYFIELRKIVGHAGGSDLFLGMKELRRKAKEPGVDKGVLQWGTVTQVGEKKQVAVGLSMLNERIADLHQLTWSA